MIMGKMLLYLILSFAFVVAKEAELPICPTNIQFFPQTLPMHCRMPRSTDGQMSPFPGFPQFPGFPGTFPPLPENLGVTSLPDPFYQNPPADKQPHPLPIPIPPPPGPFHIPGGMPVGPLPGPMPMPMMPMSGPAHKLPVIVMPFYSPDPAFKKPPNFKPRKPRKPKKRDYDIYTDIDTDTDTDTDSHTDTSDTSSDTSSDFSKERRWHKRQKVSKKNARRSNKRRSSKHKSRRRHNKKRNELLTPVLQYVTKEGYVIFEKKISKDEAKDWLSVKKDNGKSKKEADDDETDEDEETLAKLDVVSKEQKENKDENEDKDKGESSTDKPRGRKIHQQYKPNLLLDDVKA